MGLIVLAVSTCLSSTIFANNSGKLPVNPIPVFEVGVRTRGNNPVLTESDVTYEWYSFGVHAYGYTTVKNNGVDYYHYTRVQIQNIDTQYVHCSKTESGYGRVDADT